MPFRVPVNEKSHEEPDIAGLEESNDAKVDVKPDVPTHPCGSSTKKSKQIVACALVVVGFLAYRCYRVYYSEFE